MNKRKANIFSVGHAGRSEAGKKVTRVSPWIGQDYELDILQRVSRSLFNMAMGGQTPVRSHRE